MKRLASSLTSPPLVLAIVAVLAYGLLLPQLGFYWDDLAMSWIRYQLGPEAMARYFSTNRPVWGLLYQITTRPISAGSDLLADLRAVLALVDRLAGLGSLCGRLFPRRPPVAFGTALLFLVYPGFTQQWGAYLYSHFFIVLNFFLFSII